MSHIWSIAEWIFFILIYSTYLRSTAKKKIFEFHVYNHVLNLEISLLLESIIHQCLFLREREATSTLLMLKVKEQLVPFYIVFEMTQSTEIEH